jgi:hypothetical protein
MRDYPPPWQKPSLGAQIPWLMKATLEHWSSLRNFGQGNLASMPIRKSSTAAGRRVGRQSALKLFTDRDHERELLRNFFERLAHPRSRAEKPILSIWGVGGIGKSSLLKKAVEELGRDLAGLRLIFLDLDHDRWTPSTPVAEFFWQMRSQLWAAKRRGTPSGHGIETSLFDYLYFALWRAQHPGERFDLSDSVLKDLLNTSTQGEQYYCRGIRKSQYSKQRGFRSCLLAR